MYDVIIIGAGPAGISASLYAKRANLNVLVLYYGESNLEQATKIENYYGIPGGIDGITLYDIGIKQAKGLGIDVKESEVLEIEKIENAYNVKTVEGSLETKAIILSTGNKKIKPDIPGIEKYEGKGISYCAICDAFFYRNKNIAIIGNGKFAVNEARQLSNIVNKITILSNGLEKPKCEFEVNIKKIKRIRGEAKVNKVEFEDGSFLNIEGIFIAMGEAGASDFAKSIVLPNAILAENINRSIFATAQDELRPVMNGIYFDLTPDHLAVVASDGHKLVRNKIFTIKSEEPSAFILPKKPANLLKNLLGKDGGDVTIRFDERNAEVNYGDGVLLCRLIEGRYPNYNSVIPQNNPNEVRLDRLSLLAALRRVQPFANDSSNLVRFHVEGSTFQLDAEDYDFSKTATERMTCEYNGTPMSIGFKGNAFIEILGNIECSDVIIQLADSSRAGLVLPSEQPENQEVVMLMMPMLIND